MHAFERQTDRQTEFSSLDRVSIRCSAVETFWLTFSRTRCIYTAHRPNSRRW